jgi:hypothetical protein
MPLEGSGAIMKRRDFVIGSALSLGLGGAQAQSPAKLPRVGWLIPSPPTNPPQGMPFIDALAQLGWIDGKTIQIEQNAVMSSVRQPSDPRRWKRVPGRSSHLGRTSS